jgi:hypothetical protein
MTENTALRHFKMTKKSILNSVLDRFTREETHTEHVTSLAGPAYDVTHEHKFPAEGKLEGARVTPPKENTYPVIFVKK